MSGPPKRYESDLTIVIDRDLLPPLSTVPGPTIEQLADIERVRRDLEDSRETQMECPWCHNGLVTPAQRAAWLECYPELVPAPPSQPDPEPEAA